MSETIGLLILAGATLAYVQGRKNVPKAEALAFSPSAEFEVDPTRWRHNGTQPIYHTKGNGAQFDDEAVKRALPNVLAF